MQFIDEVKVFLKAGDGGSGCTSFRREKFIEFGGPDGGNGGDGGNISFVANSNVNTLLKFKYGPHIKAGKGKYGSGARMAGANGEDEMRYVPLGTEILTQDGELLADLKTEGGVFLAAKGGKGGNGNAAFKSAFNNAPKFHTKGLPGEEIELKLKLKILADVGLIGMPNVGKSTFLAMCSNAKPKIANYPFSSLHPCLGVATIFNSEIVIADIPGIIGGAHQGVGLGLQFLKHIERCKALIYMLDSTSEDITADYELLSAELKLYNAKLEEKPRTILLTKCDLLSDDELKEKKDLLQDILQEKIFNVSVNANLEEVLGEIYQLVKSVTTSSLEPKFDPSSNV